MTTAAQPRVTSAADGPRAVADVVDSVGRLPLAVRDDLATVGERIGWLMRFGRKVRIVPLLFVLVWPFLLPGLLRDALTARRLLLRDDVQLAMASWSSVVFEHAWDDEHDQAMPASTARDLVLLRHASSVLAVSVLGPPVIIIGFIIALAVAGR